MRILNILSVFIFLIFLAAYCYDVSLNFQNFPIADDYEAFFDFNNKFFALNGFWERIGLVFSQHNEHRIATLRIINLTYFYFFGKIDLAVFRIIGLVFYVFSMVFLYLESEFSVKRFYFFLPIPILMLSFAYAEIYYLAMESLSHFPMIFFTVATIYTAISKKFIFLPLLFLFFGVFSNGNGILLMPIVFIGLAFQKEFKRLLIWTLFSLLISYIYFHDYESGKSVLKLEIIPYLFKVYPIYIGGIGGFGSLKTNMVLGIVALALIVYFVIFRKVYKKELSLTLMIVFYLLTFLIISIKRNEYGTEFLQRGAYLINSIMIFVLLYLLFFKEFLRPWKLENSFTKVSLFFSSIILVGFAYQIKNYRTWIETLKYDEVLTRNDEMMYLGNTLDLYKARKTIYNIPLVSNHRIENLVEKGYFDLNKIKESVVSQVFDPTNREIRMVSDGFGFEIKKIEGLAIKENPYIRIKGIYSGVFQAKSLKLGIVIESKGNKSYFLIPALNSHLSFFQVAKAQTVGFDFLLPKEYLRNLDVKISIFRLEDNAIKICGKWLLLDNDFVNNGNMTKSKVNLLTEGARFKEDTVSRPILEEAFNLDNFHEIVLNLANLKHTNKSTKYFLIFHGEDGSSFLSVLNPYKTEKNKNVFYTKFEFEQVKEYLKKRNSVFKLDLLVNTNDQMYVSHLESVYYFYSKDKVN
ncbi:hypothetical protein [Lacihabitans sp. CS3-21]|uniref:hypothetical protein n=1 Tax=Lacihabitans sp. CS3-21 TaxID=2487332 RepID=UPI0020CB8C42|nr:hypothetical protein [Lacihabitans sp. CS3-21]MCP9747127.1 hypothetical protein [Lacihabitans sp. CS3-21]